MRDLITAATIDLPYLAYSDSTRTMSAHSFPWSVHSFDKAAINPLDIVRHLITFSGGHCLRPLLLGKSQIFENHQKYSSIPCHCRMQHLVRSKI
jgi:hypothetical protein